MHKGFLKGIKPILIKQIALLIGMCHMLNPIQKQIKTIFHTVSHVLESPNYVLTHNSITQNNPSHGHYEHPADVMQHDHSIIELLDTVFKASNDNEDSEESLFTKTKLDKHITTYQYVLIQNFKIRSKPRFWIIRGKQKNGYFENLKEPPQSFLG